MALLTTWRQYLDNKKALYHERGMDPEWEVLNSIAKSVPPGTATLGAANMQSDYNVNQTSEGMKQVDPNLPPAALYRP